MAVHATWTGEQIGEVPVAGAAETHTAVDAAAATLRRPLPTHERAAILQRLALLVARDREALAALIAQEAGKPLRAAAIEVDRAARTASLSADAARSLTGRTIPLDATPEGEGRLGFTLRRPIGIIGAITPFNWPLNLVMHKLAPAVAAGCPVVLKPADKTPLTALRLAALLAEAGLPEGWLRVLVGPPEPIADALCEDPRVTMLSFTGSAAIGWALRARAPRKHVALELGNATPAIVAEDADLELTARALVGGAFGYAGQACISVQRVYAQASVLDELAQRIVAHAGALRCGDPLDTATDVGPVISSASADRIMAAVEQAEALGAVRRCGERLERNLITPIVLTGAPAEADVEAREMFGPVVSLGGYASFEEALARANGTDFGLQAAIFTRDLPRALAAVEALDFAGVLINEAPSFRADQMPYGGIKDSGNTREGPADAIRAMTEERLVVIGRTIGA